MISAFKRGGNEPISKYHEISGVDGMLGRFEIAG